MDKGILQGPSTPPIKLDDELLENIDLDKEKDEILIAYSDIMERVQEAIKMK